MERRANVPDQSKVPQIAQCVRSVGAVIVLGQRSITDIPTVVLAAATIAVLLKS
jgi:hypothetical protein